MKKLFEGRGMKPWEGPFYATHWPAGFLRTLVLWSEAGVGIMVSTLLTADSFFTVCEWHGIEPQYRLHLSDTPRVPGHHRSLIVILQSRKAL